MFRAKASSDPYAPLTAILKDKRFWARFRTALVDALTPRFTAVYVAGAVAGASIKPRTAPAQKAATALAQDLTPEEFLAQYEIDAIAEAAIADYINPFVESISATTYDMLRDVIASARRDGATLESIIDRTLALFSPERAEMIAVTETTRLFGLGSQAAYRAQGIDAWRWMTVSDPWVDSACRDRAGNVYPQSEDFEPEHPRCRCFPAPVMQ